MAPGTPAAAYNAMSVSLADTIKQRAANPAKTLGSDARVIADTAGAAARGYGNLVNQAPKVVGIPAAGIANAVAKGVANFQTGFTGNTYKPQQFEALTLGQMWDKTMKNVMPATGAAPTTPAPVTPAVKPVAPVAKPESGYVPGAGLPSKEQIASETARGMVAQQASDRAMGIAPAAQPTNINVTRQPNGVLSFSGVGGGDGTGAVRYSGMPNWTSKQGGAGMGAADFGGEAFKPAQAEIAAGRGVLSGEKPDPMMSQFNSLMDAIGRNAGGPVGVALNKMQLQALAPLLERQMAGKTSTEVAKIGSETQRRGQDLGLEGEMARVGASVYGTDVGAETAAADRQVEMNKVRASVLNAKAKAAAGKPLSQVEQLGLQIFEGKAFKTPEARKAAIADYTQMFAGGDPLKQMIAELMAAQQDQQ